MTLGTNSLHYYHPAPEWEKEVSTTVHCTYNYVFEGKIGNIKSIVQVHKVYSHLRWVLLLQICYCCRSITKWTEYISVGCSFFLILIHEGVGTVRASRRKELQCEQAEEKNYSVSRPKKRITVQASRRKELQCEQTEEKNYSASKQTKRITV